MRYTHNLGTHKHLRYARLILVFGVMAVVGIAIAVTHGRIEPNQSRLSQHFAVAQPSVPHASINYGLPVRVQIPKIQVDASVLPVGVTKQGNMSVPTNIVDTGWYKYSALPGSSGTAVLAGHLDGLRNAPGVFSNLNKLAVGDIIAVAESNGLVVRFVVRASRDYLQNEQPSEVFTSTQGSHLNLITCTGSWDSTEHRFAKRLVVFADKM